MDEKSNDVKSTDASSAAAAKTGSEQSKDVKTDSSAVEAQSQSDVKPDETLVDFVKRQTAEDETEETTSTEEVTEGEEGKEKSNPQNGLDKKDEKEGETQKEESAPEKKDEVVEGKPVPYDRFKEVIEERNTWKEKAEKELAPKAKSYEQIENFCQREGITAEDYGKAMQAQALLSKVRSGQAEPSEALKILQPIVDELRGMTGERLPADLQAKVDKGSLEIEDAKEMALLRNRTKFGELNSKRSQQELQAQQQRQWAQQCDDAAAAWETTKRANDPDYKPRAKDTDPLGKWEFVANTFFGLYRAIGRDGQPLNPVRTPQEMTALMERAYKEVDQTFKQVFQKPSKTRKSLSSNGSSTTSDDGEPGDMSLEQFVQKNMGRQARR